MNTGQLYEGSPPSGRNFRNRSSFSERVPEIVVKEEIGDLVQLQDENGKSSGELDFLEDFQFRGTVETTREELRNNLLSSYRVKTNRRSRIPTSMSEFEMQDDLRGGCRGGLGAPRADAGELVERICKETSDHAQLRKQEARELLKTDNRDLLKTASTDTRSRTRSCIEAGVGRIRDEEYTKSLKRAIEWIVQNTEIRHANDCLCDMRFSKKRRRSYLISFLLVA